MKYLYYVACFMLGALSSHSLTARRIDIPGGPDPQRSPLRFIENAGQWEPVIRYKTLLQGGNVYFEDKAITYQFYDSPEQHAHGTTKPSAEVEMYRSHSMRLHFEGANETPAIQPEHRFPEYNNYFIGNDPSRWKGNVGLYGVINYESLYPGIDLRLYGLENAVKYDFILAPGADSRNIRLRYEGVDDISLQDGKIIIKTSIRELTEMPPVAYQDIDGVKKEVPCRYKLQGKTISFDFPQGYDARYALVIDPVLIFSTYSGSSADNWGFTATYDNTGHAYGGGIVRSTQNYPVTLGAFQTVFQGGTSDAAITKFSPDGTQLIFSTFLGGPTVNPFQSQEDQPHSMIVDATGALLVFGRTNSPFFPVTPGAYDVSHNGSFDIFVSKFSPDGTQLLASTFIGGSGDDGLNGATSSSSNPFTNTKFNYGDDSRGEVMIDGGGNVYVAACTKSANFPTVSAFQPNYGGNQDGCIFKLNSTLSSMAFSSFLGGSGEDAAYSVKLDASGNIFTCGGTASANFPASNALDVTFNGQTDGFVVKLNTAGTTILNSTFLGTPQYDQTFLLEIDRNNFIYVVGQTKGNYPIVNPPSGPVYSNAGAKQFVHRLTNNLSSTVFATVVGSANAASPNISPTAMLVDRCDNIYVMGWGGSTNSEGNVSGMPISADALDPTTVDGSDFYIFVLSRNAQTLIYGSYIGGYFAGSSAGDHVDGGTSRFDKNGIVYHAVCAGCWGNSSFPTTPGAWSTTNNATGGGGFAQGCNMAVFKMSFDLSGVEADFIPLDDSGNPLTNGAEGCEPLVVEFDNTSNPGLSPGTVTYFWDFGDGGTSTLFEPVHTYLNDGSYTVMLIITDSLSCNISDTTFSNILVYPRPQVSVGPNQVICRGDTVQLTTASPAVTYAWSPASGFVSATNIPNPQVAPLTTTAYILTITDANGCEASDTVTVEVQTSFQIFARTDTTICRGGSVPLNVVAPGAVSYLWTADPLTPISNPAIFNPIASNVDTTTWFYITAENAIGCEGKDSVKIEVFEVFTLEDTFVCSGGSIQLTTSNGVSFSWLPNNGTLSSLTSASPIATPLQTTTYNVTAVSAAGCISTKDILVEVKPAPTANAGRDAAICIGDAVQLQGSGGLTFSWSPATNLSNPNIANPTAAPLVTTSYVLLVTDALGCQDRDTINVRVNRLPVVSAGADVSICSGESAQLQASGAVSYEWTPTNGLSSSAIANPLASPRNTTTYIVTGLDANGCQDSDTIRVSVVERPITTVTGINRTCVGGSIELTASGGTSYVWSTGDTTAVIRVTPAQSTTYIATAYVGQCAGIPDTITIDVRFDYPVASFTADPVQGFAPQEITLVNTSTGSSTYLWSFEFGGTSTEETPRLVYPVAGEYTITLIAYSGGGCPDTATQTVRLENVALHVPSGFTPNGDAVNEAFLVGYYGIRSLNVRIYSRWGILVYESDEPDFRWDGNYKGTPVPEGVYVYHITGVGENNLNYERNGTVTVVR